MRIKIRDLTVHISGLCEYFQERDVPKTTLQSVQEEEIEHLRK